VRWVEFEAHSPELAGLIFEKLNRKIAYLATIKKDGSPRLHPVTPFIGYGMLYIFTEPSSPKIRDLRRDGRYALHSSVGGGGPLIEILLSGRVQVIPDPDVRIQAESIASSPVLTERYVLFEFGIEQVLIVEYEGEKPVIRRWSDDRPGESH
jgi:hypothetical protein